MTPTEVGIFNLFPLSSTANGLVSLTITPFTVIAYSFTLKSIINNLFRNRYLSCVPLSYDTRWGSRYNPLYCGLIP